MKTRKTRSFVISIVIIILVIISAKYYFLGPNLSCALDSQGIKFYILKSNLISYGDTRKHSDGSQSFDDWNIIDRIRNNASIYAQDANNCYGKHTYQVKNENVLDVVSQKEFNTYLIGDKFNNNFCENAALLTQSGNSPVFVKERFCTM
ncbi:MAG: hypothetical protein WCS89_00310 [Candidatus Paceibacterota bacterium]